MPGAGAGAGAEPATPDVDSCAVQWVVAGPRPGTGNSWNFLDSGPPTDRGTGRACRAGFRAAVDHYGLANAHHQLGDLDRAREHWTHALGRYAELGVPEANQVRDRLTELDAG